MRQDTVEIADRSGQTFKMELTTYENMEDVAGMVQGELKDVDLMMTGLKEVDGRMGHIRISNALPEYWRAVDKGHLRYDSGKAFKRRTYIDLTTRDLVLTNLDGTWGMKFWDYSNCFGVNKEGNSVVVQPWVMQMHPGKFSWVVID